MYLCAGGLRAKQEIAGNIERILFVFRRMVRRNVQRLKIIIIRFDLRSFHDFISHAGKNSLHFFHCNRIGMPMADFALLSRQRNVDDFGFHLGFQRRPFHFGDGLFQYLFNLFSRFVDELPHFRPLFRRNIFHSL